MTIRRMTDADIESVLAIERASFVLPWSKESFVYELTNRLAYFYVLEDDGKICGYSGMWNILGETEIANIAVSAACRRKGYGKLLVENILKVSDELSNPVITLEVRPSNTAARALYQSFGFMEVGRRTKYYLDGEDALILKRTESFN